MQMASDAVGYASVPLWMVRNQEIDQHMLLVFLALSSHVGEYDVVWPGQETIATEARLGLTSVKEALVRLRDVGLVQWRRRPTGGGYVNEYRILVSRTAREDSRPAATPGEGQPPDDQGTAAQRLQGQPPSGSEEEPLEEEPGRTSSSSGDDGESGDPAPESGGHGGSGGPDPEPGGEALSTDDELFEDFWHHYPKKVSRKDARTAFGKALKLTDYLTLQTGLVSAIKAWRTDGKVVVEGSGETLKVKVAPGEAGKGVPHAATWLNGERWNDEYPDAKAAAGESGEDPNAWMHRTE